MRLRRLSSCKPFSMGCKGLGRCAGSSCSSQSILHVRGCYFCCKGAQSAPVLIRTVMTCFAWSVLQRFHFGGLLFQTSNKQTVWWAPLCMGCCCYTWSDLTTSQQPRTGRGKMIHVQRRFLYRLNQAVVWKGNENRNCSWASPSVDVSFNLDTLHWLINIVTSSCLR